MAWPQWGVNTTTWTVFEVGSRPEQITANTLNFPAKIKYFGSKKAADDYALAHGGQAAKSAHSFQNKGIGKVTGGTNIGGVTDFLSRLSQANTWIRVGEVALGLVLIAVGVARLTGAQNAVSKAVKARI